MNKNIKPVVILELSPEQFDYIATQVLLAETELPPPELETKADLEEFARIKYQVKAILDQARVQSKFDELADEESEQSRNRHG